MMREGERERERERERGTVTVVAKVMSVSSAREKNEMKRGLTNYTWEGDGVGGGG